MYQVHVKSMDALYVHWYASPRAAAHTPSTRRRARQMSQDQSHRKIRMLELLRATAYIFFAREMTTALMMDAPAPKQAHRTLQLIMQHRAPNRDGRLQPALALPNMAPQVDASRQ